MMEFYPAIDLMDGQVVRLSQGRFDQATRYFENPPEVANRFREAGASWIHVVDLSGARDGQRRQTDAVLAICESGLQVQCGGGVRHAGDVEALLDAGVARVVVGSRAVTATRDVIDWIETYGAERIALALDVRRMEQAYRLALRGWVEQSEHSLFDVIDIYRGSGLKHALVTDIGRDGDLTGPNLSLYSELAQRYPDIAWQASGGVSGVDDIKTLLETGASGVIAGRALYENKLSIGEVLACLRDA